MDHSQHGRKAVAFIIAFMFIMLLSDEHECDVFTQVIPCGQWHGREAVVFMKRTFGYGVSSCPLVSEKPGSDRSVLQLNHNPR